MAKWKHRDEGKKISKSVVKSKTTEELLEAKKFLKGLLDLRKSEKLARLIFRGREMLLSTTRPIESL